MKILILTNLYPPHFLGGYELKCSLHAEQLRDKGHEVYVLTSCWKAEADKVTDGVYRLLKFNTFEEPPSRKGSPLDPFRLSRRYQQLRWALACRKNYSITRKFVVDLKPDVGFIWNMGEIGITPILAIQKQKIPLVFRLGDYWLADLKYTLCLQPNQLRRIYNAAILGLYDFSELDLSRLLVVSRALMQHYVALGFPEQTITVIPNGVPAKFILHAFDLNGHLSAHAKINLVQVNRIDPKKGVHIAIQALAKLVNEKGYSNLHLDIIGKGSNPYTQQLKTLCASLGLNAHISFIGFLEHQHLLERLPDYTAMVLPSLWEEPLAGVIAESMARGVPVIASHCGGSTEIISHGENGLLVPPGDPNKLADAIEQLIQDPALVQKIRYAGLETVREHYTHEPLMDQIESQLQEAYLAYQSPQLE